MDRQTAQVTFEAGANEWNSKRHDYNVTADLTGFTPKSGAYEGYEFNNVNFSNAQIHSITFFKCTFQQCVLQNCCIKNVHFVSCTFTNDAFQSSDENVPIAHVTFIKCELNQVNFSQRVLSHVAFSECKILDSHFGHCKIFDLVSIASFVGVSFDRAIFSNCDLSNCTILSSTFKRADLSGTKMLGVIFDGGTNFENAIVKDIEIETYSLVQLDNYGNLTPGQRMTMKIHDPVAEMVQEYSGFWQWVHMGALFLFLSPYIFFAINKAIKAHYFIASATEKVPLLYAMWDYIITGGGQYGAQINTTACGLFWYAVVYNVLRFIMLYKTKTLELKQNSTGLPVVFTLSGRFSLKVWRWDLWTLMRDLGQRFTLKFWRWKLWRPQLYLSFELRQFQWRTWAWRKLLNHYLGWGFWLSLSKGMFFGNVIIVLWHLYIFLMKDVPVN